jgi:hypothetical protein
MSGRASRGAVGVLAALAALALPLRAVAAPPTPNAEAKPVGKSETSAPVEAATRPIRVLAVNTDDGQGSAAKDPPDDQDRALQRASRELGATLRDSVQDLGFVLDLGHEDLRTPASTAAPVDGRLATDDLLTLASQNRETWLLAPSLTRAPHGKFRLALAVVAPNRPEVRTRVVLVAGKDVVVQGLVLARALLESGDASCAPVADEDVTIPSAAPRSAGRSIVGANGAVFGAFAAYGIQRASGSSDPRVTYPLLAIGTAVGLGTGLLVAEEWDVRPADAWYLAAGSGWGATSGLLLANGQKSRPLEQRYSAAVGAGAAGLGLAGLGLLPGHVSDGGATLTHSGAAYGLFFGGLTELAVRGTTQATPRSGAGVGTAFGLVAAGAAAHLTNVSTNRVLLVDLSAGLGALGGAAIGSPFVFGTLTPTRARMFLGATALGTLGGAAIGLAVTQNDAPVGRQKARTGAAMFPNAGVITTTTVATKDGTKDVPAWGVGMSGTF